MATGENKVPFIPGVDFYRNGQVSNFDIDTTRFPEGPPIVEGQLIRQHSEVEILLALQKARGFRSIAAQILEMTPRALNKRIAETPNLIAAMQDIEHYWLDHTEIKLFEAIDAGNVEAIKFYLKCKGKKRGWLEARDYYVMGIAIGGTEWEDQGQHKAPDLVLGFVDAVNPNAPDGTSATGDLPSAEVDSR